MNYIKKSSSSRWLNFIPLILFVGVALFLTFKVFSFPTLVIGDNFRWNINSVNDILGPKIVRQSYMGDIAVLSTFKSGFLYPLTYLIVTLNLSTAIVYPFLFYVLAMSAFYFFAKEFLKNKALIVIVSVLYIINPITPYYYASIINAFSLIFLPIGLMFFVRSLKELKRQEKTHFVRNLAITSLFLGLAVSANEQFVLSVVLISVFLLITFTIALFQKFRFSGLFLRKWLINLALFALVFGIVCLPLVISLSNIQSAPLSTYFQSSATSNFLQTVQYTYKTVNLGTVLRLGGDSGSGLGTNSWYDNNNFSNYFGYTLFAFFITSVFLLVMFRKKLLNDRLFFSQNAVLFLVALVLIFIIKGLNPSSVSNGFLAFTLKTWESPIKLDVLLLVSILVALLLFLKVVESSAWRRKKIITGLVLTLLIATTIVYDSPWLVGYAGQTTLQQVADSAKWGTLYNQTYIDAANSISQQSATGRGIILPYTHKAELYSDPNTRVFQTLSAVNSQADQIVSGSNISWSKSLGLFSINSLAVMNGYDPNDGLIFPERPLTK